MDELFVKYFYDRFSYKTIIQRGYLNMTKEELKKLQAIYQELYIHKAIEDTHKYDIAVVPIVNILIAKMEKNIKEKIADFQIQNDAIAYSKHIVGDIIEKYDLSKGVPFLAYYFMRRSFILKGFWKEYFRNKNDAQISLDQVDDSVITLKNRTSFLDEAKKYLCPHNNEDGLTYFQQFVVSYKYTNKMAYKEIKDRLYSTEDTIKSQNHEAKQKLRQMLKKEDGLDCNAEILKIILTLLQYDNELIERLSAMKNQEKIHSIQELDFEHMEDEKDLQRILDKILWLENRKEGTHEYE